MVIAFLRKLFVNTSFEKYWKLMQITNEIWMIWQHLDHIHDSGNRVVWVTSIKKVHTENYEYIESGIFDWSNS